MRSSLRLIISTMSLQILHSFSMATWIFSRNLSFWIRSTFLIVMVERRQRGSNALRDGVSLKDVDSKAVQMKMTTHHL